MTFRIGIITFKKMASVSRRISKHCYLFGSMKSSQNTTKITLMRSSLFSSFPVSSFASTGWFGFLEVDRLSIFTFFSHRIFGHCVTMLVNILRSWHGSLGLQSRRNLLKVVQVELSNRSRNLNLEAAVMSAVFEFFTHAKVLPVTSV